MKTKNRLMLWLGTLLLLITVLGAVGLGTIWKLRREGQDVLKANYNSIEYMQRMFEALDLEGDTASAFATLDEQFAKQRANVTEIGETGITEQLAVHLAMLRGAPSDRAVGRAVRKDINDIIELNRAAIARKAKEAELRAETAVVWISIVGTICFLIAFTLFLSLPERIAEPIRKLTEGIDRIAEGHYRERVEIEGGGEFGHMAQRFNAMASELEKWENCSLSRIMEEKARAEAVINSLQDASIGLDENGRILFVNRQALELLGMEEQGTVGMAAAEVGQRNDLLRHVLSNKAASPFKAVLGGKENYFVAETTMIRGAEGPLGSVCTVRNITPFQERDQAKTHFLATISHELKTPLASTDIGLTLLERSTSSSSNEDQNAIVRDLRKDHQRLVRIVSELLDLAQVESGGLHMQIGQVELIDMIRRAMQAVNAQALQKKVRFELRLDTDVPNVQADSGRGEWVLVNLLSNAIRHSPELGLISISSTRSREFLDVIISDGGSGIPVADHERIFTRFVHLENSAREGTGLGLSIAREFMDAMGGTIAFDKAREKGASFTVRFLIGAQGMDRTGGAGLPGST